MIRILHLCPGLDKGGISSVILNYYKKIDRTKFHFDFGIFAEEIGASGKELEQMGAKIYLLPQKRKGLKKYIKALDNILKNGNYDVVHAHENYMAFIALGIAKRNGIKVRVVHSHSANAVRSGCKEKIIAFVGKALTKKVATNYVACGKLAAKYLYGKRYVENGKVLILPNAIKLDKFKYNNEERLALRKKYNVGSNFVVGTLARLSLQKNLAFYVDCMKEITKNNSNIVFVVFGVGSEENNLREKIQANNLTNNVFLLGNVDNAEKYYNMFDLVVLPSLFEGFPMVGVEALANGVNVLFSDSITHEFEEYFGVKYLSIQSKDKWVEETLRLANELKNISCENDKKNNLQVYNLQDEHNISVRNDNICLLEKNNLNIDKSYKLLEKMYEDAMNG